MEYDAVIRSKGLRGGPCATPAAADEAELEDLALGMGLHLELGGKGESEPGTCGGSGMLEGESRAGASEEFIRPKKGEKIEGVIQGKKENG